MQSVRYGDTSLQTEVEAEPLTRTTSGEYYLCTLGGSKGSGWVAFTVDSDGVVERAHDRSLP
jgi:hypothetical protein